MKRQLAKLLHTLGCPWRQLRTAKPLCFVLRGDGQLDEQFKMMAGRVPAAKRGAGGLNRTDLWEAARKRLARESDHRRVAADDPELRQLDWCASPLPLPFALPLSFPFQLVPLSGAERAPLPS